MMKNGNDLLEPVEAEEEAWAVEMQREEEEAAVAASTNHAEQSPTSRTSTTPSPREATNETLAGGRLEVPHGQSYLVIHVA